MFISFGETVTEAHFLRLAKCVELLVTRSRRQSNRIADLEQRLEQAMTRIADMDAAITTLEANASKVKTERDDLAKEKADLATEKAAVEAERDELQTENDQMVALTERVTKVAADLEEPAPAPSTFEPSANRPVGE